ncbi:HAAS signaling domain-containing protein [Priestia taiwanensis]|uniref:Uncharacterized protein n=1 Tax=Priestia taiwanensis TaxID=1347902 RepID=A0A917AN70_9BACI|nr:hypothetical protein [Priestia taiwanensis]MBM7362549.1 hypothetical protein [Priestia taiwanensis]GGE63138.1 hypothetical protein GCM10007140_11750 [Priestia taiwanensis]
MEMINRYIHAVTEKLAPSQQEDIAKELRSLIQDLLDERVLDKEFTTKDVEEVLLELGDPSTLADSYRDAKKSLIGPSLFDSYISVLKIVLIVTAVSVGVSFIVQSIMEPTTILGHFTDSIVSLTVGLPLSFGWVTLVFAIMEYYGAGKNASTSISWKPSDLPAIPDPKGNIKQTGPIIAIIFYIIVLGLVVSTHFVNLFGIHRVNEGAMVVPFLNAETFSSYSLFIVFLFGIAIVKELFKLAFGKWTLSLVILNTCINAVSFVCILYLITSATFWNPDFMTQLTETGIVTVGTEGFEKATKIWESVTYWLTIILVVSYLWDTIEGYIHYYKSKKNS